MRLSITIIAVILFAQGTWADTVYQRGRIPPIHGRISMDDAGVSVVTELGATHFVPWDRVKSIDSEAPGQKLKRRLEVATDLWRARSRVQRNDTTLAEPLFERLFEQYLGQTHETSLVVAEGLLRCRLARGDHVLAVIPALETARLRRAKVNTDTYSMLVQVMDDNRSLCPQLAPVWLESPLLKKLVHDLGEYNAQGDEVIAAIASLYRQALLQTLGEPQTQDDNLPNHEGVKFLSLLVSCRDKETQKRSSVRERLKRKITNEQHWTNAWSHMMIGLSLISEDGQGRQLQGIVNLLHLPARFVRSQPYLAGLALYDASKALNALGDFEAADALSIELRRILPNHPIHSNMLDMKSPEKLE